MVQSEPLRNTYFLLRHGDSIANQRGVIVSSPAIGIEHFGLSERGVAEVRSNLQEKAGALGEVTRIYSSDFLRARQTAEIAAEILETSVEYSWKLRERGFGDWEGGPNENYQRVWERDSQNASHQDWNVESVRSVSERTTDLLTEIERGSAGNTYLLVSHGDPLQILITAATGIDLRLHRGLEPLKTAELRRIDSGNMP